MHGKIMGFSRLGRCHSGSARPEWLAGIYTAASSRQYLTLECDCHGRDLAEDWLKAFQSSCSNFIVGKSHAAWKNQVELIILRLVLFHMGRRRDTVGSSTPQDVPDAAQHEQGFLGVHEPCGGFCGGASRSFGVCGVP